MGVGDDSRVLIKCHAGCEAESVCEALGLRLSDLFPSPRKKETAKQIAEYNYLNIDRKLLFQVVRFQPKSFRQRRPNGKGGWIWNLRNVPRVLYRLNDLVSSKPDDIVFIPEGEKDVERLYSIGLCATCNPGGAGKWNKLSDDSALSDRRIVIIADKDAPGRKHALDVANRLCEKVQEIRIIEVPGDHKDVSEWLTDGGTIEKLWELVDDSPLYDGNTGARSESSEGKVDDRPAVLIDTDEHRVVRDAITALASDPEVYQRCGMLVRVIRTEQETDDVSFARGPATIDVLPESNLRERLTRCARFERAGAKDQVIPAHPTSWLTKSIIARGDWPGLRHLHALSESPVLRSDGSIWQQQGYDAKTQVLFFPRTEFPLIAEDLGLDDAILACNELLDVVGDFRFEAEEHKAAWLAALLTPLARFAFSGPAPLFLIDANVRGAGKGLLAQTMATIVLGHTMPVSSYAHDSDELRKKITAIAIAGDRMVLFDNLKGLFGNDTLDRALTSTRWKDRLLGKNQEIELPLLPTWFATGNNVQVSADSTRRIIHIRLDVLEEYPEDRSGFRHPNLLEWISEQRPRLLTRAIIILSAYLRAGCPCQGLTPFGSFEAWSAVVRGAITWVNQPDPCATRQGLVETSDNSTEAITQLMVACLQHESCKGDFAWAKVLRMLYPDDPSHMPRNEESEQLRNAIENFVGCKPGQVPKPKQLASKLRQHRRRVIAGVYLDVLPGRSKYGKLWKIFSP